MAVTSPSADLLSLYQRIQEDARPEVMAIDGRQYTTRKVHPVHRPVPDEPLQVSTLESVAGYFNSNPDKVELQGLFIRVASPVEVRVEGALQPGFLERPCYMRATAMLPVHRFGQWLDTEDFSIWLQACFSGPAALEEGMPVNTRAGVLKFISRVVRKAEAGIADNGTTQAVELRTSIGSKAMAALPNPVTLQPFRTFAEVEQPAGQFVFRVSDDKGIAYRLDEADGGAWRIEAVERVASWLSDHIAAEDTVILF